VPALQAHIRRRKIGGVKQENGGYRYWIVQCEECDKLIPLRRYRGFVLSWPEHFEVQCECKFVGNYHRAEMGYATLPALIPREQLPKIKAVQPAAVTSDDVSSVAAPNSQRQDDAKHQQ